jgi:hypothetical protein
MSREPSLSIVLPCRNQADHIGEVLPQYIAPLESLGMPFEIIAVPNASTDSTQQVVEQLALADGRIRVVANPQGGWGRSVRMGLDAARGSVLAYTNSARTNPVCFPDYVRLYAQHVPCLVKARRELRKSPLRELGSMLYNLEGHLLFGIRAQDVNGTPKVFSRELYCAGHLGESGDLLDMELMAQVVRRRIPIVEVPVQGFQRHGGKSSTTLKSAWKMYAGAVRLWLSLRKSA